MASAFSGKAGRNAALWTAGFLQNLQPQVLEQLQQGKDEALGYLSGPGGASQAITAGYGDALAALERLYGQGAEALREAQGIYKPIAGQANAGFTMLGNALGLGGAEGTTAAQAAFQAGPGYQWQVDQATEAANRQAAKLGLLTSGNAQEATAQLAANLANQEWGNWIKNLQPYQGQATTLAQSQAQTLAQLANLYGQQGQATAGLFGDQGKALASILGNEAGIAQQTGQAGAETIGSIGSQIANVGMQGLQADQTAAQNRFSALTGGLQLAGQGLGGIAGLGVAGGGTLGGNFLSNLKSIFS